MNARKESIMHALGLIAGSVPHLKRIDALTTALVLTALDLVEKVRLRQSAVVHVQHRPLSPVTACENRPPRLTDGH